MSTSLSKTVLLSDSTNINLGELDLGFEKTRNLSFEDASVLSENSNTSISRVVNRKSFLERVKSIKSNESDLSIIFRKDSLNQIKLKKKKCKKNDSSSSDLSDCSISLSEIKDNGNLEERSCKENKTSICFNVNENESLTHPLEQTTDGKVRSNLVKNGGRRNLKRVSIHFQCDSVDSSTVCNESSSLPDSKETSENSKHALRRSKRNNVSVNFSSGSDFSSNIQESGKNSFNESSNLSKDLKDSGSQKLSRKRKYVRDEDISIQLPEDPSSSLEQSLESKGKENPEILSLSQCKDFNLNKENNKCYSNLSCLPDIVEDEIKCQNIRKNSVNPSEHHKKDVSVNFDVSNMEIDSFTCVSELASDEQKIKKTTLHKSIDEINIPHSSNNICELNGSQIKATKKETYSQCDKNAEQITPLNFDSDKDNLQLPDTDFTSEYPETLSSKFTEGAVHRLSNIDYSESLSSEKFFVNKMKDCDKNVSVQFSITRDTHQTFSNDNTLQNSEMQASALESCDTGKVQISKNPVSVRFSCDMEISQLSTNVSNCVENAAKSEGLDTLQSVKKTTNQSKNLVVTNGNEVVGNCENMLVSNTVINEKVETVSSPLLEEASNKDNGERENINATFLKEKLNLEQSVNGQSDKSLVRKELEPSINYQADVECSNNLNTTYTIATKKSKIPVFKGNKNIKENLKSKQLESKNEDVITQEMNINDVRFSDNVVDNLRCQSRASGLIELQNLSIEPEINSKISINSSLDSLDYKIKDVENLCLSKCETDEMNEVLSKRFSSTCEIPDKIVFQVSLPQASNIHADKASHQEEHTDSTIVINGKQILESQIPDIPIITMTNEDISIKEATIQSGPIHVDKSKEIQDCKSRLRDSSVVKAISETLLMDTDKERTINMSHKNAKTTTIENVSHSSSAGGHLTEAIVQGAQKTASESSSNKNITRDFPSRSEIQTIFQATTPKDKPHEIKDLGIEQREMFTKTCSNSTKNPQRITRSFAEKLDTNSPIQQTPIKTKLIKCTSDETSVFDNCANNVSHVTSMNGNNTIKMVCPDLNMPQEAPHYSETPQEIEELNIQRIVQEKSEARSAIQETATNNITVESLMDKIPVSDENNVSHITNVGKKDVKMINRNSEKELSDCYYNSNVQQECVNPSSIQNILPVSTPSNEERQKIVEPPSTQQKSLSTTNSLNVISCDSKIIGNQKTVSKSSAIKDISEKIERESFIQELHPSPTNKENVSTHSRDGTSDNIAHETQSVSLEKQSKISSDKRSTGQNDFLITCRASMKSKQENFSQASEVQNESIEKNSLHTGIARNIPTEEIKGCLRSEIVTSNVNNETKNDQTTKNIFKTGNKLADNSGKHSITTQVAESQPLLSSGVKQMELRGKRKSVTFASTVQLKNNSRTEEILLTSSSPVSKSRRKSLRNSGAHSNQTVNSDFEISMTVALSPVSSDIKSNERMKKAHSTPIKDKSVINNTNNKENELVDDHVFARPDVPLSNRTQVKSFDSSVSDVKRKESTSDESEGNISKRRKTIDKTIDDLSNDNLLDVSEIPLDKTMIHKKLIYHSTPIASVVERPVHRRNKKSRNNCNDKNIQVSKSIFGTSSEATTALSKKSGEGLSTAYSYDVSLRRSNRISLSKSKDNSNSSRIKISKSNLESDSDTSASEMMSTKSTKVPLVEKSSTSTSFYSSNNAISTLSRGRSVDSDHSEVSPKRVCFRNYSSHIDIMTNSLSSRSYHSMCETRDEEVSSINSHSEIQPSKGDSISIQNDKSSIHLETDINMNEESIHAFDTNVSENITIMASPSQITQHSEISLPTSAIQTFFGRRNKISASNKVNNKDHSIFPLQINDHHYKHNFQSDEHFDIEGKPYVPPKIDCGKHVPPSFLTFCINKIEPEYGLRSSVIAEQVISHLNATISAVKTLTSHDAINSHTLVLRNILNKFAICKTTNEYCTLVRKYTPFDFQRKVLPLGGYCGGLQPKMNIKSGSPLIAADEVLRIS